MLTQDKPDFRYDARCPRGVGLWNLFFPAIRHDGDYESKGAVGKLLIERSGRQAITISAGHGWSCLVTAPFDLSLYDETVLIALTYLAGLKSASENSNDGSAEVYTGDYTTTFRRIHEATCSKDHFRPGFTAKRITASLARLESVMITLYKDTGNQSELRKDFPEHCFIKSKVVGEDVRVILSEYLTAALQKRGEFGGWFLLSLGERAVLGKNEKAKIGHRFLSVHCLRPAAGHTSKGQFIPLLDFVAAVNGGKEKLEKMSHKTLLNRVYEARKLVKDLHESLKGFGWTIGLQGRSRRHGEISDRVYVERREEKKKKLL
ncbi:hypothetical protein OPU71_10310 [Niveibacterium sp. 24ML]|uniref:hypothetical protein n=1 Tax=Niveibacterium sp. 24ML TaxID=2985512 RepID=UPI00226E844B|nr:hypothetical protein [Niveibacterium sp. 24ML]MCX9156514.1 hypothetical protein [Niveibacterium sp. 24ML]